MSSMYLKVVISRQFFLLYFPCKVPNLFDIVASFMYTSLPPPFLFLSLKSGRSFYPFICNFTLR